MLAPAIREAIANLLRGAPSRGIPRVAPAPQDAGRRAPAERDDVLSEARGAARSEIAGEEFLSIERGVDELFPELDLAQVLGSALRDLAIAPTDIHGALAPARGRSLSEIAVLDIETTGFWGCPIFLVGLLLEEEGRLVTRQLLARDYPEERAILREAARLIEGRQLLVTFNGKSFDVPFFCERAALHRIGFVRNALAHVDLLHIARRTFRGSLPNCRLATLERAVVGIHRSGDIASADIPAAYHRFASEARVEGILPVLRHSRLDLVTTAILLARLIAFPSRPQPCAWNGSAER